MCTYKIESIAKQSILIFIGILWCDDHGGGGGMVIALHVVLALDDGIHNVYKHIKKGV